MPGRIQVEVSNLAHAGNLPSTSLAPRVIASLRRERYDVSVYLWGFLGELVAKSGKDRQTYTRALLERARIARAGHGQCLIQGHNHRAVATVHGMQRLQRQRYPP